MSRLHSEERRSATALSTVGYSLVEEALAECLSCITKVCARARPPTVDCRAVLATLLSEHLLEAQRSFVPLAASHKFCVGVGGARHVRRRQSSRLQAACRTWPTP